MYVKQFFSQTDFITTRPRTPTLRWKTEFLPTIIVSTERNSIITERRLAFMNLSRRASCTKPGEPTPPTSFRRGAKAKVVVLVTTRFCSFAIPTPDFVRSCLLSSPQRKVSFWIKIGNGEIGHFVVKVTIFFQFSLH